MGQGLQTINYHQGLISFSIPADLSCGYDPQRQETVFYQEREGAGVLRLHYAHIVPFDPSEKSIADLAGQLSDNGEVSPRDDGALVCTKTEQVVENDQDVLVFHWFNLSQIDDQYIRIAHLSYSASFEELQRPECPNLLETLSRELTMLAWSQPGSFYASLRTVLAPVHSLNETIVQYEISEQVAMAIACAHYGSEFVEFLPYADLDAWCLPADEAWRQAFENMDQVLSETPVAVEELVNGVPMAFFDTTSQWQAALITAPSLKSHVESSIGWPVQAILPCQDFLHLIPANWEPSQEQVCALSELILDEYMNSPCALSTELFMIDDHGIHARGRFQADGFVATEASEQDDNTIEDLVESAYPNPVQAHQFYNRGLIYSTMLHHRRAIESFSRAIELEPGVPDYYRSRAVEYELVGDNERANQDSLFANNLTQQLPG